MLKILIDDDHSFKREIIHDEEAYVHIGPFVCQDCGLSFEKAEDTAIGARFRCLV